MIVPTMDEFRIRTLMLPYLPSPQSHQGTMQGTHASHDRAHAHGAQSGYLTMPYPCLFRSARALHLVRAGHVSISPRISTGRPMPGQGVRASGDQGTRGRGPGGQAVTRSWAGWHGPTPSSEHDPRMSPGRLEAPAAPPRCPPALMPKARILATSPNWHARSPHVCTPCLHPMSSGECRQVDLMVGLIVGL